MKAHTRTSPVGRRNRRVAATAAGALAVALVATVPPAHSAVGQPCPAPYPAGSVSPGQPVTGLTVTQGTEPEEFTGEVVGRLEDGLVPGIDLVVVRLSSPEIERAGIWAGMSGSPVYAEDGRLIGAVAYGFAGGASPIAGVTPAAEMLDLLDGATGTPAPAPRVALPRSLRTRVVEAGDASRAQAKSGLAPLRVPVALSGVSAARGLGRLERRLDADRHRLVPMGAAGSARAGDPVEVTPGGNLAASLSYGDVTVAGLGTATAVCAGEVVGFGHPMDATGKARLAMHGAEAVFVQEDPTWGSYKLGNLGAPAGTINQDRLVGIAGPLGARPRTRPIRTNVTYDGRSRTGRTHVVAGDWFSDVAFYHLLGNVDRFIGLGGGSGEVTWRLTGKLEDGREFRVRRHDAAVSRGDVSWRLALDMARPMGRLQWWFDDVALTGMRADLDVSREVVRTRIRGVDTRRNGRWAAVRKGGALHVRAGRDLRLRVALKTPGSPVRRVVLRVPVRDEATGARGVLRVAGGGARFLDKTRGADTAEQLIHGLRRTPSADEVVALLDLPRTAGGNARVERDARAVVSGGLRVPVRIR